MDRIQNAIAKARATRQGVTLEDNMSPALRATSPRKNGVDAAWAQIPMIPLQPKLLIRNHILTNEASAEAIPFDLLRTRILKRLSEKGWSRMAVTSPAPASGKSTTLINLALSISRKSDYRVIVLETDMRRPRLSQILDVRSRKNLSDVLTGRETFANAAIRITPNLALVTQTSPVRDAGDILIGSHVSTLLENLEQTYQSDLLLFDTPPLLTHDDTTAVLQNVNCALLMAEAGRTTVKDVDVCEKEIASYTNVMGIALNKCRYIPTGGYEDYR